MKNFSIHSAREEMRFILKMPHFNKTPSVTHTVITNMLENQTCTECHQSIAKLEKVIFLPGVGMKHAENCNQNQ